MKLRSSLFIMAVLMTVIIPAMPSNAGDIKIWYPLGYGKTDASGHRYFAVETDSYKFVYDMGKPSMTELYNKAKNPTTPQNLLQTTGGPGGFLSILDSAGKTYLSHLSNGNTLVNNYFQTRMTFRQAGRVYYRIDVYGIKLTASDGTVAPVTARMRFHIWPEKYYVETKFEMTGDLSLKFAESVMSYNQSRFTHFCTENAAGLPLSLGFISYLSDTDLYSGLYDSTGTNGSIGNIVVNWSGTSSVVMFDGGYANSTPSLNFIHRAHDYDVEGGSTTWASGTSHIMYSQMFFSALSNRAGVSADALIEANPVPVDQLASSFGMVDSAWYDNRIGAYKVTMPPDHPTGVAENTYADAYQNYYETTRIRVQNDYSPRQLRLNVIRGNAIAGSNPWAELIITDPAGFPIGVPTEQNSAWEAVEPDSFFACYVSIPMDTLQTRDFDLKLIQQNWGTKPMIRMQCQDLNAWSVGGDNQQWMQTSIGQGENMCFQFNGPWSTITDARGLSSRPMGPGNTWRDNCGGWEFLKLNGSTKPGMRGLLYKKSGVNLFNWVVPVAMDDGSITGTVETIALPANELTRTFFKVRYDVKSTINISSMSSNLRLFAFGDETYVGVYYTNMAYTNSSGAIVNGAVTSIARQAIGGTTPWACTYDYSTNLGTGGNRGFVLRSYKARVNGTVNNTPAINVNAGTNLTRLSLTTNSTQTRLIAGDYFEFEIEAIAYGVTGTGYAPMQTEATSFATGKPAVSTVYQGTKISDFPARVDIGADGYADFTITGGRDIIPVEIGGFDSYATLTASDLRVEELVGSTWVPIDESFSGRDWWQTEYDSATGLYSYVLALYTDGSTRRLRVGTDFNKSEAETRSGSSNSIHVYAMPSAIGGYYTAADGNSPVMGGAWMTFSMLNNSGSPRRYTPFIRYASIGNATVHLEINGLNVSASSTLPPTNGPGFWSILPLEDVSLNAGNNEVKIVFENGGAYLDWIEYRYERPTGVVTDDAVPVSADVPYNASSNIPTVCSITMKNTGSSTWTSGAGYALYGENEFGIAVSHPVSANVPPGSSYTFTFTFPTPQAAVKLYHGKWYMRKGTTAFGAPLARQQKTTDSVQAYENCRLVSAEIPAMMGRSEIRPIQLTFRNTGTTTWNGSDVADYAQLVRLDSKFGSAATGADIDRTVRVAPGGSYTFSMYIIAPSTTGVYALRLRMNHRGTGYVGPTIVRYVDVVDDLTPPITPEILDDGAYATVTDSLSASFFSYDVEFPALEYQYAIGTSSNYTGNGLIRDWVTTPDTLVTATGLSLAYGNTYYFYVRARNSMGIWSLVGASDGIKVVKAAPQIADVKKLQVGDQFFSEELLINTFNSQNVFVEEVDRCGGLKLNWQGEAPDPNLMVRIAGTYLGIVNNEPTADMEYMEPMGIGPARPLATTNKSIGWPGVGNPPYVGLDTRCLLVKVWGSVTYVGSGYFLIDDGSGLTDYQTETGFKGLKVTLPSGATMPTVGQYKVATGVVRASSDSKRWIMATIVN